MRASPDRKEAPMSLLFLLMVSALQAAAPTPQSAPVMPAPIVAPAVQAAVTLECSLQPNGSLRACQVVEETPAGHGLGARALREARLTRYSRPTAPPRPGEKVRFTTRYPWPAGVPVTP
jgi:hypothetical protein